MQKKKPTRKQEQANFAAQLQASNFWGHVQFATLAQCWETFTGEKLPEGMHSYVLQVVQDVVRVSAENKSPMKLDGTVAAAIEQFLEKRPDRMVAVPESAEPSLLVTPAQAREEALEGAPLVVLK